MRRNALVTYLTLAVSGWVHGVALSFDSNVMSLGSVSSQVKVPIAVFETIILIFVSSLLAQLLQAVSNARAEAMRRLQEQSNCDALTGLATELGTGFATYSYLKRYEVDEIKIDGTFVTALGENQIDIEIVQSMVRVAKMLKVKTVAEFVSSDALLAQVLLLGVDYVQGYAIGMPQPLAAMYPSVDH